MSLKELLSDRKKDIVKKWQKEIFQLYPADSIRFLTSESNQFANPVGNSIREHTEKLFNELLSSALLYKRCGIVKGYPLISNRYI